MAIITEEQANSIIRALWKAAKDEGHNDLKEYLEVPTNRLALQEVFTQYHYTKNSLKNLFESGTLRRTIPKHDEITSLLNLEGDDEIAADHFKNILQDENFLDYESQLIADSLYASIVTNHPETDMEAIKEKCDKLRQKLNGTKRSKDNIKTAITETFGESYLLGNQIAAQGGQLTKPITVNDTIQTESFTGDKYLNTDNIKLYNLDSKLSPTAPMTVKQTHDVIETTKRELKLDSTNKETEQKLRYLELLLLTKPGTVKGIAEAFESANNKKQLPLPTGTTWNPKTKKQLGLTDDSSANSAFQKLKKAWEARTKPTIATTPQTERRPVTLLPTNPHPKDSNPPNLLLTTDDQAMLVIKAIRAKSSVNHSDKQVPDIDDSKWDSLKERLKQNFFIADSVQWAIQEATLPEQLTQEEIIGNTILHLENAQTPPPNKQYKSGPALENYLKGLIVQAQIQSHQQPSFNNTGSKQYKWEIGSTPKSDTSLPTKSKATINAMFDWDQFKTKLPNLIGKPTENLLSSFQMNFVEISDPLSWETNHDAIIGKTKDEVDTNVKTLDMTFADNDHQGKMTIYLQEDQDDHKKYDYVIYPTDDDTTIIQSLAILDASTTQHADKARKITLSDEWSRDIKDAKESEFRSETNEKIKLTPRAKIWIHANSMGFITHDSDQAAKAYLGSTEYDIAQQILSKIKHPAPPPPQPR